MPDTLAVPSESGAPRTYLLSGATLLPSLPPTAGYSRWSRMRPEFFEHYADGVATDAFAPAHHQRLLLEQLNSSRTEDKNVRGKNDDASATTVDYVYINQDRAQMGHIKALRRLVNRGVSDVIDYIEAIGRPLTHGELCELCHQRGLNLSMLGKVAELLTNRVKIYQEKLTTIARDIDIESTSKNLRCLLGTLHTAKEEMCLRAFKCYWHQLMRQEGRMLQRALEEEELEGINAVIQRSAQSPGATQLSTLPSKETLWQNRTPQAHGNDMPTDGVQRGRNKSVVWSSELAVEAAKGKNAHLSSQSDFATTSFSQEPILEGEKLLHKRLQQTHTLFKGRIKTVCSLKILVPQKVTSLDDDEVTFAKAEQLMRSQVGCGAQRPVPIFEEDYQRLLDNRRIMRTHQREEDELRRKKEIEFLKELVRNQSKNKGAVGSSSITLPAGRGKANVLEGNTTFGDATVSISAQSLAADYALHLQCLSTVLVKTLFGKDSDSKVMFMWHNYIVPIVRAKFKYRDLVSRSDVKIRTALTRLQQLTGLSVSEATEADLEHDWKMTMGARKSGKSNKNIEKEFSGDDEEDEDEMDEEWQSDKNDTQGNLGYESAGTEFHDEAENIAAALNASSEEDEQGKTREKSSRGNRAKGTPSSGTLGSANVGNTLGQRGFEKPSLERARAVLNRSCRATRACVVGSVTAVEPVVKMPRLPSIPPLWCFAGADESTSFALECILQNSNKTQDYETALTDPLAYHQSLMHTEVQNGNDAQKSSQKQRFAYTSERCDGALQPNYNTVHYLGPSGMAMTKFLGAIAKGNLPLTVRLSENGDVTKRFGFAMNVTSTVSWVISNTADDTLRTTSLARKLPLGIPLRTTTTLLDLHSQIAAVLRSIGDRHFNECENILLKLIFRGQMQRVIDVGLPHVLTVCLQLGLLYWVERRFTDARRTIAEAIQVERQSSFAGEDVDRNTKPNAVADEVLSINSHQRSTPPLGATKRSSLHQALKTENNDSSFSLGNSQTREVLNTSSNSAADGALPVVLNNSINGSLLGGSPKRGSFSLSKKSTLRSIMNAPTGPSTLTRGTSFSATKVFNPLAEKTTKGGRVGFNVDVVEISDGESPTQSHRTSFSLPNLPLSNLKPGKLYSAGNSSFSAPEASFKNLFLSRAEQSKKIETALSQTSYTRNSLRLFTMFGVLGLSELGDGHQQAAIDALETAAALLIGQLEELREGKHESVDEFFARAWPNMAKVNYPPAGLEDENHFTGNNTFITDAKRPYDLPSPRRRQPLQTVLGGTATLDTSGSDAELNTTRNLRSTQAHLSNSVMNGTIKEQLREQEELSQLKHCDAVSNYDFHQRMELLHKTFLTLVTVYHPSVGDVLHSHVSKATSAQKATREFKWDESPPTSPTLSSLPEGNGVTLEGYNLGIPSCLLACRELSAIPAFPQLIDGSIGNLSHRSRRKRDNTLCRDAMENLSLTFDDIANKLIVAHPPLVFLRYLHLNARYALMASGNVSAALTLYQRALHIVTVLRDAAQVWQAENASAEGQRQNHNGVAALHLMTSVLSKRILETIDGLKDVQQGLSNAS